METILQVGVVDFEAPLLGAMEVSADGVVTILLTSAAPRADRMRLIEHALCHVPEGPGFYGCTENGTYDHWT